jgi:hypothetical protein
MTSTEEFTGYWGEGEPVAQPIPPQEYENIIQEMVREDAPRRFAVVQDWGTNVDGRIAAWGIVLNDRTVILDAETGSRTIVSSIRLALRLYGRKPHTTARICWVDPE